MFHVASFEQVRRGEVVDVYFTRTAQILRAKKIDARVRAEFICKGFPNGWRWGVLAGLEEVAALLKGVDVRVRAVPEGTVFSGWMPVLEIEGRYLEFGHLETAVLGLICQASGVATGAARCRIAAGDRGLYSFGARRMHPVLAPMLERNAYIGGCDGVAVGLGAALVGQEPIGTMPHALILIMGDTVQATLAFDEVIDPAVPRISLIDTFNDEKFEALNVARAMGGRLFGVRLDTPASRRGSMARIVEEVRWELALAGFGEVKITVSGGLDEASIAALKPLVDSFGVGTAISSSPVVDFSMDIVEVNGHPRAKRGKMSGSKEVWRCPDCQSTRVFPGGKSGENLWSTCSCGGAPEPLLGPLPEAYPKAADIRAYVLAQLSHYEL